MPTLEYLAEIEVQKARAIAAEHAREEAIRQRDEARGERDRLQCDSLLRNLEQWDILPGGTYEPAFLERMRRIGARFVDVAEVEGERDLLRVKVKRLGDRDVIRQGVAREIEAERDRAWETLRSAGEDSLGKCIWCESTKAYIQSHHPNLFSGGSDEHA